jgi:hypothetical protein
MKGRKGGKGLYVEYVNKKIDCCDSEKKEK